MIDETYQKKQIAPLLLVNAFLRSDIKESQELDTIAAILLQAIAGYIGMSLKRICYAKRDALMHITKIKSTSTYTAAIERLKKLKLIKSNKKWKVVNYEFGQVIIQFEKFMINISSSGDEHEKAVKKPSSSGDEHDQVRETNTTIERENDIKRNNMAMKGYRENHEKILICKKENNMSKNNYFNEDAEYEQIFYKSGVNKNESYKKLSSAEIYNNNFRARYHEAVRLQELREQEIFSNHERQSL